MPIVSTSTRSTEHLNGGGDEEEEDIAFPVKANTQRAPWDSEDPPTSFNGVGSSLLDQLEEQLPADSPSVRIEDETLGISGVPPSDPELETVSSNTQKRDYSQLEPPANLPLGSTSAPIGSSTSNPVQPSNKRFKPDQLPTTSPSIPLTQPMSFNSPLSASSITREFPTKVQSPNIIAENVAPTASTILPSTSQDHAIISKTIEPDEDGDDSSDFEMPEINLEPDTDDELEEDDDSREGDTEDQ
ncbi:hypothetical protein UCRPC4_g01703 [Phaeomoniella chlamydospora]|uniref:Uncharacterized protein n=1 Tax=Phaeomoniella chlamydospora TaxID=158046 RepID=A0A0G2ESA2_PHACM|nr:hypothetical protein UCRPC4_g01703 [Phaeomoniella chlamydospora]